VKIAPFWKSITVRIFAALVGVSFACIAVSVLSIVFLTVHPHAVDTPLTARVLFHQSLLLALLGIGLSLVLGLFVSRAITRPLVHLLQGTRTISAGNLGYRISIRGGDEVRGLADSFNSMVESLQARTAQLVESERRYRLMTERVNDIIFTLDENGMITYLSTRLEAITGYVPANYIGTFIVDRLPAHEQESARAILRELLEGEHRVDRETQFEFFAREGRKMIMEAHLTADAGPGGKRQVYGVARDVSERARLLEQLNQAQKMEAVGRLAGGVAHDFNNLLTAIIGYCDYSMLSLDDSGTLKKNLEEIKKAGNRAAALTQQLLAFSRRQVMRPRILDLNQLISNLEKLLRRLLGEDIALETRFDAELGSVLADPGQIEQVIMNLCINSRDAMPRGGRITMDTANVSLDSSRRENRFTVTRGDYVRLRITDTGSGMDKEIKSHLFEPFFTTKEVGRGTGLGLSTVYGIVKQTGGYIWAESAPGKGTSFDIYFPRVQGDAEAPSEAAPTEVRGGRESILLVEDEAMIRVLVCNVLGGHGYVVYEADDGEHAEDIIEARGGGIDLIITDVVLPGMSGRELVERLAAAYPGIPALFMSGYTRDVIDNHGVLHAGLAFLQKPFSPEALLRKVREVLDVTRHA
jgi:PAS domain S-box-containing protein